MFLWVEAATFWLVGEHSTHCTTASIRKYPKSYTRPNPDQSPSIQFLHDSYNAISSSLLVSRLRRWAEFGCKWGEFGGRRRGSRVRVRLHHVAVMTQQQQQFNRHQTGR